MKRIGFLINPIAGMGGRVGLKGTDGVVEQARALGARPVAPQRATEALRKLAQLLSGASTVEPIRWLTCSGIMGEEALRLAGFSAADIEITYTSPDQPTAEDTKSAVRSFLLGDVDLIFFCGGDGTARDICSIVGIKVQILGIPSGVKMYSGVFGTNPVRTAEIVWAFLQDRLTTAQTEVLDLDEARYREGEWNVRLYHAALTPYEPMRIQLAKAVIEETGDAAVKDAIAVYLLEEFERDKTELVFLGPGSTVKSVGDRWGIDKTLLGIDAVVAGKFVGKDLNESDILHLLDEFEKRKLVLSPIGAQGFVLGRGNLQLSPGVISAIGVDNIIVIATPAKLARTPELHFDTGNATLDDELTRERYLRVVVGYRRRRLVKVVI
ncbi:MAG: ATP-NAD kinase [Gammaproteobacteria bacterium]|nr:MAG: ATP-NAD kinase [Gammaproteobacteria bacterium]RLA53682.1 MAG: ATP-NAD kinase [Gammaproteobacteria bacterium]